MATARKVHLTTDTAGILSVNKPTQESAETASRILQENHENYNLFFNDSGFHNHIVHGICTLYGLGATPDVLQKHFDDNRTYQKPPKPLHADKVEEMATLVGFKKYLGNKDHTHDYLEFFTREIEKKGPDAVLQEYVFAGDERANDMFSRMFMGFLHPIIHTGFGIEFQQPAIIAEGLAEAAVHENWLFPFFTFAESSAANSPSKALPKIIQAIRANDQLRTAAHWDDSNKIQDGVLARASEPMIEIASQFKVPPTEEALKEKTAEMFNTALWYTAAAQKEGKDIMFDFYFMHCVNSAIFFPTINELPWLSLENKARLLEWKGRLDLAMYASRACPSLDFGQQDISSYLPASGKLRNWDEVVEKVFKYPHDDGHLSKLVRAVAVAEKLGKAEEGKEWMVLRDGDWESIANMVVDSVGRQHDKSQSPWMRSAGFDEAWEEVSDREKAGANL